VLAGAVSPVDWNRSFLMGVRNVTASAASATVCANQMRTRRRCVESIELSINLKFGRQNSSTARNKALFRGKLVRSRKFALPTA
jgi:hypothetical protein